MTEKSGMIFNFVNDAVNDMSKFVNKKIAYKNQKFNHRLEFFQITKYIDDFLNGIFIIVLLFYLVLDA